MRRLCIVVLVSMGVILMAFGLASAQVQAGNNKVSLELSGQLNRALLIASDGDDTKFYNVDNDSSSSRFRIVGRYEVNNDFSVGTRFEAQFESNSTASVNQDNPITDGGDFFGLRKAEIWFDTPFGTLSLGQGSTASDFSAESDLSGTFMAAYSGVADIAAGILFFDDMLNDLTNTAVGDVFLNLDGLGRNDRIGYDSPIFGPGLRISASLVQDDIYDVALKFASDKLVAGLAIQASVAYAKNGDLDARIVGSISVLHDSGFNVTFAAGADDVDNSAADPSYWYVKLGYSKKMIAIGKTSIVIDFYSGEEAAEASDESKSVGFGVVQQVDVIAAEFYFALRNYDLERDNTDLNNVFAAFTGARVKF